MAKGVILDTKTGATGSGVISGGPAGADLWLYGDEAGNGAVYVSGLQIKGNSARSLAFNLGDFDPMEGTPALTSYRLSAGTNQGFRGWAFDPVAIEMIGTMFILPDDWVSGSTVETFWMLSVAADASEDVRVTGRMGCSRAGSTMPGTGAGTDPEGVTIDVSSGAQWTIYTASFPFTPSGLVAGDVCFLNIQRDATHATDDDYDSDLVLIGVRMDYIGANG